MTSITDPFAGFNFTPEEPQTPAFTGFDFTPEEELTPITGVGRQVIKGVKEAGVAVAGLPGDVGALFDLAANKIAEGSDFLLSKGLETFSGVDPEITKGVSQEAAQQRAAQGQTIPLPGTRELQERTDIGIQDIAAQLGFDIDTSPQSAGERVSRRAIEFGSTAPLFAAGVIPSAAAGVVSQVAEELGFGGVGQLVGALGGAGVAGAVKGAGKALISPVQSTKAAGARTLALAGRVKPQQIKSELIKDAAKAGVELPVVAQIDNNLIKSLYTKAFQSGLTGEALEAQVKNTTGKIIENIKRIPSELGGNVRESREVLGQQFQDVASEFVKTRRNEIGKLYDTAREGAEGLTVNGDKAFRVIQKTKSDLERTLVKGAEKKQTIAVLDEALGNILTEKEVARGLGKANIEDLKVLISEVFGDVKGARKGLRGISQKTKDASIATKAFNRINKALNAENAKSADISKAINESAKELNRSFAPIADKSIASQLKEIGKGLVVKKRIPAKDIKIPVNTVIETIKDINDIVKFENFGGTNKLLLRLKGDLNKTLDPFKQETLFGNALETANKEFAELAEIFQADKKMASLLKNPEGKGLIKLAESPEGFERLLKTLPAEGSEIRSLAGEGQAVRNLSQEAQVLRTDLRRTLVEDAILKPMTDKRGNINIRRASNVLANKDSARLLKHLIGEDQFKNLVKSQKFAQSAADGIEKFMNMSQSAVSGLDVIGVSSAVSGIITSVATMNPIPAIIGLSPIAGAKLFTAIISDPEMVQIIIDMGQAAKISNTQRFIQAMTPELKSFTHKLGQIAAENGISPQELGIEAEEQ